jgi:uncharacterized protein (TIGR00251 family)
MGPSKIPFRKAGDGVTVDVRVRPRSSRKGVEGVEGGVLVVRLTAPPADGRANAQLIEVLSEAFGARKSDISIVKGRSSRNKVVEIKGYRPG